MKRKYVFAKKPCQREVLRYGTRCQEITVLTATQTFILEWNKLYLLLPSLQQIVFICRPRKNGRLSWPMDHHGE